MEYDASLVLVAYVWQVPARLLPMLRAVCVDLKVSTKGEALGDWVALDGPVVTRPLHQAEAARLTEVVVAAGHAMPHPDGAHGWQPESGDFLDIDFREAVALIKDYFQDGPDPWVLGQECSTGISRAL